MDINLDLTLMTTSDQKLTQSNTGAEIRDASVLIVIDSSAGEPQLLMGKRNSTLAFMPGKYVFPGGAVDPEDFLVKTEEELNTLEAHRLQQHTDNYNRTSEAQALPLAAIRETFEETGVLIGRESNIINPDTGSEAWDTFLAHNIIPSLSGMKFCARAITPENKVRRYDTRFFCVEAVSIAKTTPFNPGELDNIEWLTLTEATDIDLPRITRVILNDILAGIKKETLFDKEEPVPFYYTQNGRFHREIIR